MAQIPQIFRYNIERYKHVFLAIREAADLSRIAAIVACTDFYSAYCLADPLQRPLPSEYGLTVEYISFTAAKEAIFQGGCRRFYVYNYLGLQSKLLGGASDVGFLSLMADWFAAAPKGVDMIAARRISAENMAKYS